MPVKLRANPAIIPADILPEKFIYLMQFQQVGDAWLQLTTSKVRNNNMLRNSLGQPFHGGMQAVPITITGYWFTDLEWDFIMGLANRDYATILALELDAERIIIEKYSDAGALEYTYSVSDFMGLTNGTPPTP